MAGSNLNPGIDGEIVGLIPAGGVATRIAPLPCSKEVYPIGFRFLGNGKSMRPKAACHYLFEKMRRAGITKAFVVLRKGKWDIPAYFEDGAMLDMKLAYMIINSSLGPPYTLDQAYPFVKDATVAFGFPDIIFTAKDAFTRLIARQSATGADIVLGLFPAPKPQQVDMVDVDRQGRIRAIFTKPRQSRLRHTWVVAVWSPVFSRFMHRHLRSRRTKIMTEPSEVTVGHIFQAALDNDLNFQSVVFDDNSWIDIGRPDDLVKAARESNKWSGLSGA